MQSVANESGEDAFDQDGFDAHDDLFSGIALAGLQAVEPSCTLRSTQKSTAGDDEDACNASNTSSQAGDVFDLVSDSNDEDEDEMAIADLLADR